MTYSFQKRSGEFTIPMSPKNEPYVIPGIVLVAKKEWHLISASNTNRTRTLSPGEAVMVLDSRRACFDPDYYYHLARKAEVIDLLLLTGDEEIMILSATDYDYSLNPDKDPDYAVFLGTIFDFLTEQKKTTAG